MPAASNLLYALHFDPDCDARALLNEHRRWASALRRAARRAEIRPHPNDRTPDRRLRIGFVSPDFRDHPVGQCCCRSSPITIAGEIEIVGYSDVRTPDGVTEKLRALADRWHDIAGLRDPQLADLVRDDGIDSSST